ncbi:hypothetical protein BV22DRAFT_644525 [Leucogyrophana mollusca]|uniref:Uncharacterized protein n=1 Tax=Leucogyrophana mollusca TaxID=85980 RepID=A0ACB8BBR8_9AGAM|nr:hypothetical protein BV22DRAFT_644525 [Leucogyrophana mollusca]
MPNSASYPFDHVKADVIFRSCDDVDFRIFKLFLTLASPFFESMFELPQPLDENADSEPKDGLPVISVSEDSRTLDILFRFCYPSTLAEDPNLNNLGDVVKVLGAARKYALEIIERRVGQALANPDILEKEPLRCFAIARHSGLQQQAKIAAKYTLHQPLIPTWIPEIELITATDLLSLLDYHQKCSIAVARLAKDFSWITSHYSSAQGCFWLYEEVDKNQKNPYGRSTHTSSPPSPPSPKYNLWPRNDRRYYAWWTTYMDVTLASLKDRPSRATVFEGLDSCIQSARASGTCADHIAANMTEFAQLFANEVEKLTSNIKLLMNF